MLSHLILLLLYLKVLLQVFSFIDLKVNSVVLASNISLPFTYLYHGIEAKRVKNNMNLFVSLFC